MKLSPKIFKERRTPMAKIPDNKNNEIAEKTKSIIDDILGDVSKGSAAKQLVLGASTGWITGFVSMKIGKMAAVAIGGGIILLQVAQHKGYIKIDWDKVQKHVDKVADKVEKEATGRGPNLMDKLERYVDQKIDKAEGAYRKNQRKARSWYHSLVNNGEDDGYQLQELHLFIASFAFGVAFGVATG